MTAIQELMNKNNTLNGLLFSYSSEYTIIIAYFFWTRIWNTMYELQFALKSIFLLTFMAALGARSMEDS